MNFNALVLGMTVVAGALGGAWAHFGSTGQIISPQQLYAQTQGTMRSAMRRMDKRYYRRGETYDICITGYGKSIVRTMSERVWSCECVDKSIGTLSRRDRQSALAFVTSKDAAPHSVTVTAERMLQKCDIDIDADIRPVQRLDLELDLRGTR